MDKLKVLVCEVGKQPEVREIDDTLKTKQKIVGGYIQLVPIEDGVAVICNEDGILEDLPANRLLYIIDGKGNISAQDMIVGDFFIVGFNAWTGEPVSLTDEQIEKLTKIYAI